MTLVAINCPGCGKSEQRYMPQSDYCHSCCRAFAVESLRCSRLVTREVQAGRMARAKEFDCADCEAPAAVYDHRDYTKPLEVDPVCYRCNRKRGHAMWHPQYAHATPAVETAKA